MTTLVFLDLETTGFHPQTDHILEIGAIAVDDNLQYVSTFNVLMPIPEGFRLSKPVHDLHEASGLLHALETKRLHTLDMAEEDLWRWLQRVNPDMKQIQLAGFSVPFDRAFIAHHMPRIDVALSHRMVDVSSIRTLCKMWKPSFVRAQAASHRAVADCEEAIAELEHYRSRLWHQQKCTWQCWEEEDDELLFVTEQAAKDMKTYGMLKSTAVLQYELVAYSRKEAFAEHYKRQGWGPYQRSGEDQ